MNKLTFKTIQGRLTFWFLLLALAPLMIGIIITFSLQIKSIENKTFDKLTAIRDLKVHELEGWLEERQGDIKLVAADFEIRSLEFAFKNKDKSSNKLTKIEIASKLLSRYQTAYNDYEELFIIDAETGLIGASSNPESIGLNRSNSPYFTIPLQTHEIYIRDIYHSTHLNKPQMTFSIPIYCLDHDTHIIGVLVVRISLERSLYRLLANRVGMGETGESLIVDKNVFALNELKYKDNAILRVKIDAEPAVLAAAGNTGITKTLDYRGKEILAAYTYIPQTKWGIICKQDMYELNAPIRALIYQYLLLFFISVLAILIIVFWVSKKISKPIKNIYTVSNKIKDGEYSSRNTITSADEIGALGNAINEMAASIESKNIIQEGISDINQSMIGNSTLQNFIDKLLKQLIETTKATMGSFYVLNQENTEYEHHASVGVNQELMINFNARNPEGEFSNVISKRKIIYLYNIPEDTKYKYITTLGSAIPKGIITIPILVDGDVLGIITIASIHGFAGECFHILENSWIGINTAYSNLLATEKTRLLAKDLFTNNQQLEAQTEELQDQAEELQDQAEELQQSSEELQEQNVELEAQKKQVESANQLKSEFLSNMSHELRTPLNSIMALSRVLISQAKNKLNDDENSYLEIVERNGKRLLSLINNILDLSKIESGKMDITPATISLGNLLQMIKENIHGLSDQKKLSVQINISKDFPQIETDESRLHQVLLNIVSNAVKFTQEGAIEINVKEDSNKAYIEIKDSGIGISKEALPYIFDEFRQVDGSTSRQYQGTGLGLAIANKLIQILGGSISAKSKLGSGSSFTICIPIKWYANYNNITPPINTEKISAEKTILVVDDDPTIVQDISAYLNRSGYKTITTTSGREALKLAKEHKPFAITLDVVMPDMDGWEVLQELKKHGRTKDIPVIIVSVSNDRETGFALGAVGYINKPINKILLMSEIYKLIKYPDTVMIVDDNDFERKQITSILQAEKINTIDVDGGKECINILQQQVPDILVLDLMMPEMDGFQVLEKIRQTEKTKDLPVIIVTAKDLTTEDKDILSGNIATVITKSKATQQDILHKIKQIVRGLEKPKVVNITKKLSTQSRILIVEDNLDAIIQVKEVLEKENYIVDLAPGGPQALEYLKTNIPDGIILDLMMPDIDGFEVINTIRAHDRTSNIPVLILTAKDLSKAELASLNNNNIQQIILKGDINIEGLLSKVKFMLQDDSPTFLEEKIEAEKEKEMLSEKKETETSSERNWKSKPRDISGLAHILVIEDHPDNMVTIKAILHDDYKISEAIDGEQGLAMIQSLLPDLILLDMGLPKKDGEEILRIINADIKTKDIPTIAVTAMAMKGDREKFISAGCVGYIAKPIDVDLLLEEIKKHL